MPRRPVLLLSALAAVAVLSAGCGSEPFQPPDLRVPQIPERLQTVRFPEAGVRFKVPPEWRLREGHGSLVAAATSGTATVAVWRYRRQEPLPDTPEELRAAEQALLEEVMDRDPDFDARVARTIEVNGRPAVQIVGVQRFGKQSRRIRSTHIFGEQAEIVVDAYAPPGRFDAVDEAVFQPLTKSLRIARPRTS